ncbi:MAG: NAD(P)H-dependent glycerol-3-phosphate dehydrogenase [Hyphomicrobiales bacterium]
MGGFNKIAVIGGGSWGTALATVAARAGRDTVLWARRDDVVRAINERHENERALPGIALDEGVRATADIGVVAEADAILLVTPAQTTREVTEGLAALVRPGTPVVLCAKGIERETGKLLSEIIAETLPMAVPAVLSGPSFATDVARNLPTAVTVAAGDLTLARALSVALSHAMFRPYASSDIVGVQVGGALKNVLAIGCGIVAGRGLGASAQAALTARGFTELSRLAQTYGVHAETLTGLSCLGDLVLTCSTPQSRNFSFGIALGRGASVAELLAEGRALAEGAKTASVAVRIAKERSIEIPISMAVEAVIEGRITVDEAVAGLMSRPLKSEGEAS